MEVNNHRQTDLNISRGGGGIGGRNIETEPEIVAGIYSDVKRGDTIDGF